MKTIHKNLSILLSIFLVSGLVLISSCDGGGPAPEPEPTVGELAVINLTKSAWKLNSVTVDGIDKSSMFANMTITFTPSSTANGKPNSFNGSFTATNGGVVWPTNGTWTVNDPAQGTSLHRDDGLDIQLTELTATSMKLNLAWSKNTFGTGRIGSIKGQHAFTFGK